MAGSTIITSINNGITLGPVYSFGTSYPSPLTIAPPGGVTAGTAGDAIVSPAAYVGSTLINQGTVKATGTGGSFGVDLLKGGSVTNSGTGLIQGYIGGVFITGSAGTVSNSGTIAATGTAGGYPANIPGAPSGYGVYLFKGGSVANTGTGLITGYGGVVIRNTAGGTAGTVTNSGTISATGINGEGVIIGAGGSVINSGTIFAPTGYVVDFKSGGFLTNSVGGYIGKQGVQILGTAGTVINDGRILNILGYGVNLANGGSVGNTGRIDGSLRGVYIGLTAGTVTNSGTITGTAQYGVSLASGGSVGNTGTGLITGNGGVFIQGGAGTITNLGSIIGTGGLGIRLVAGGTVVDAGTISGGVGTAGTAIYFGGAGSNLLALENGYKLSGSIVGSGTATNTLELAGSVSGAVTVGFTGLGLTNFQDVLFGAGGHDTLQVSSNSGTFSPTISGFTLTSDIIDLTAIGTDGTITGTVGTVVTVTGSLGSRTLLLDGTDGTNFTTHSDGSGGTDLVACFCRGTRISTDCGEVAVEDLAIGDRVITFSDAARPIKWIGRRAYDGRFIAANRAVLPIRVEAGALGDGVPARDLFLSPEHALYIDGGLVPAGRLTNGATIRQVESIDRLEYFHIELAAHDVLLAEGAPAETFIDCDNRFMFHNGDEFAALYPDDEPERWEFCAPRVEPGRPS